MFIFRLSEQALVLELFDEIVCLGADVRFDKGA